MVQQLDEDLNGPVGSPQPLNTDSDIPQEDELTGDAPNSPADDSENDTSDRTIGTSGDDALADDLNIGPSEIDPNGELNDYDDDVANDPARIARDRIPPLDSTTPDDGFAHGSGNITGDAGSMGVPTGSGATGAYSSGSSEDTLGTDTTSAGGDI